MSWVVLKFITEKVLDIATLPILKLMEASKTALPSTFQISASLGLKDMGFEDIGTRRQDFIQVAKDCI